MMRNTKFYLILVTVLLLSIYTETSGFPLKVEDDFGREIEFLKPPERIISLAPSNTEILFAMGLGDKVVGVTKYCNYPPEARAKEKVGGFMDPDVDKILDLESDLIFASGTLQESVVETLEEKGQKVFWLYSHTVEDILNSFETIGRITDNPLAAARLRQDVEGRLKRIEEKLKDTPLDKRPTVFRVMGMDPPGTIGANSFQSDIHRIAGGRNVFGEVKEDYFPVTVDWIIKRNPDVIIICGDDPGKAKEKLKNQEGWKKLDAVRNDSILVIPCDIVCRPGPRVAETAERMASFLYPQVFPLQEAGSQSK